MHLSDHCSAIHDNQDMKQSKRPLTGERIEKMW